MRLRVVSRARHPHTQAVLEPGSVVDFPDAEAQRLLGLRHYEIAQSQATPPPADPEPASTKPVEWSRDVAPTEEPEEPRRRRRKRSAQ